MNRLTIIGNLTKDPEIKNTPSGKTVCKMNVAVNDGYGENKKVTYFVVEVWGNNAENCNKYLRKGLKIAAEGSVSIKTYIGKDGSAHGDIILSANSVEFLSRMKDVSEKMIEESRQELDLSGIEVDF